MKPSLFQRGINFLFGYDFFISYAWSDARVYALKLAEKLAAQGFECFLDSSGFAKGENWQQAGGRALRKTARLLVLLTPGAQLSAPVRREIEIFRESGRMIMPIAFGSTPGATGSDAPDLLPREVLRIQEQAAALATGPSEQALREIRDSFDLLRQNQKRIRWLAGAAGVFAVVAVVAVGAGAIAELRRREALSRSLASQAIIEGDRQLDLALLLAAQAQSVRATNQSASSLLNLLHRAPVECFLHGDSAAGHVVAHPTKTDLVATATWAGTVEIWDVRRHMRLASAKVGDGNLFALSFTPDGRQLCAGGMSHELVIWKVPEDGAGLEEMARSVHPAGKIIRALHYLADGSILVAADEPTLRRFFPSSQEWTEMPAAHTAPISVITRDASGTGFITGGSDWKIVFWEADGAAFVPRKVLQSSDWILSLALSPDGKWLAAGTHDKAVELWNLAESRLVGRLPFDHPGGRIFALGYAPDGRSLWWGGDDGAVNIFDLEKGGLRKLFTHRDAVLDFCWTQDGTRFVSAGRDGSTAVWNLRQLSPLARDVARFTGEGGWVTASAFSDPQDSLILGDEQGNIWLCDVLTGSRRQMPATHPARINSLLALDHTAADFVSAGADGKVRWWRCEGDAVKEVGSTVLTGAALPRSLLRTTNDGGVLAVTATGAVHLCHPGKTQSRKLGECFATAPSPQPPPVFSVHPTQPLIVAASRTELTFFNYEQGTRRMGPPASDFIRRLQFSPTGHELWCAQSTSVEIRETGTGGLRSSMQIGRMPAADWTLGGTTLLCADSDASLTWWDLPSRAQLGTALKLPAVDLASLHYSAKRKEWITLERTFSEGRHHYLLRAWKAEPEQWARYAKQIANRSLSETEAARFGR